MKNWQGPTNAKELQRFLGLANYYRRFIRNFSKIAAPLHKEACKEAKLKWNAACAEALDELKHRLATSPVLVFPNFEAPFILETDASGYALGAVLAQCAADGKVHPVAFASRLLRGSEKRYAAIEREALAVAWAMKNFRYCLYGQHVTVVTEPIINHWSGC